MDNNLVPKNDKKHKINFSQIKKNTTCSLFEVEHFLCNFKKCSKFIKIYKIIKH